MELLEILAIAPAVGLLFMAVIITRETWIGGLEWKK